MTAYLMGAATVILLVLILWRRSSPEFRRRSEQPKFQFLANLGFRSRPPSEQEKTSHDVQPPAPKGTDEEHEP